MAQEYKTVKKTEFVPDPILLMKEFGINPTISGVLESSIPSFYKFIYRTLATNDSEGNPTLDFLNSKSEKKIITYDPMNIAGKPINTIRIAGEHEDLIYKVERMNGKIKLSVINDIPVMYQTIRYTQPMNNLVNKIGNIDGIKTAIGEYEEEISKSLFKLEEEEQRLVKENSLEYLVQTIADRSKTGQVITVKGKTKLECLIDKQIARYETFTPGISYNPHHHTNPSDTPSLYYQKKKDGKIVDEIILSLKERIQKTNKEERIYEFVIVKRSDASKKVWEDVKDRWEIGNIPGTSKQRFYLLVDEMTIYPEEFKGIPDSFLNQFEDLFDNMIGARLKTGKVERDKNDELYQLIKNNQTRKILEEVEKNRPEGLTEMLDFATENKDISHEYKRCLLELIKIEGAGINIYDSLSRNDKDTIANIVKTAKDYGYGFNIRDVIEGIEIESIKNDRLLKHQIYSRIEDRIYDLEDKTRKNLIKVALVKVRKKKQEGKGEYDAKTLTETFNEMIKEYNINLDIDTMNAMVERIIRVKELNKL